MDDTPNLALPYIAAAQSQKHVTHNEALRALDALVQIAIKDRDLATPPLTPQDGDRYIVPAGGAAAWGAAAGTVAAFQDGAWIFYTPRTGWLAWIADEQALVVWTGSAWTAATPSVNPTPRIGVNATADAVNRLTVKSDAVLFSHDDVTPGTGDMRIAVNKTVPARSASVLYQTGFSGRAEIGLTGDDTFQVKISSNGTSWQTALISGLHGSGAPMTAFGRTSLHTSAIAQLAYTSLASAAGYYSTVAPIANPAGQGGCGILGGIEQVPNAAAQRLGYFLLGSRGGVGGESLLNTAGLQALSTEPWTAGSAQGTELHFATTGNGTASRVNRWVVEHGGALRPFADNAYALGTSSFRVSSIWAANGTIQTSDARDKIVTGRIDGAMAAASVDMVAPVQFRWKVGGHELRPHPTETITDEGGNVVPRMDPVPVPGKRVHAGFLAQDVKAAMDAAGVDFGVWGLDDPSDPESRQWLRPDQIIPVLWAALRETRAEVARLKNAGAHGPG